MIDGLGAMTGNGILKDMLGARSAANRLAGASSVDSPADTTAALDTAGSATQSANLLADNFVSREAETSRYILGNLASMHAAKGLNNQKISAATAIMQQAKMDYANAASYGEKYAVLKRAEKSLNWSQQDAVRQSAEETHLKQAQDDVREKAEAAVTPQETTESSDATGTSRVNSSIKTMKSSSGATVSGTSTSEAAPQTTEQSPDMSRTETAAASAPITPTIDILV